jgi:hypothetical protein
MYSYFPLKEEVSLEDNCNKVTRSTFASTSVCIVSWNEQYAVYPSQNPEATELLSPLWYWKDLINRRLTSGRQQIAWNVSETKVSLASCPVPKIILIVTCQLHSQEFYILVNKDDESIVLTSVLQARLSASGFCWNKN